MREDLSDVALRLLGTRDNVAALEAVDTTVLKDGAMVFITDPGALYALLRESTAVADGEEIVEPTEGPGRWFLQTAGTDNSGLVITHDDWYVDPTNGDDSNDGMTLATAFKTYQYGLSPRFDGARMDGFIVVTQVGSVPASDVYWANTTIAGSSSGEIYFFSQAIAVLLTGVITAATLSAVGTRGQFTVAGADFTGLENKRVRITAGTNVGTIGWISRVISATTVNVTPGYDLNNASGTTQFRVGDTIIVEELARGPAITGICQTRWNAEPSVSFESLHFESTNLLFRTTNNTNLFGCKVVADWVQFDAQTYAEGCYLESPNYNATTYQRFVNCMFRLPSVSCQLFEANRCEQIERGMTLRKGKILTANYMHFYDWPTADLAALTLDPGTFVDQPGRMTGTSTQANTYGVRVRSRANFVYTAAGVKPLLTGPAAFNVDIGGTQLLYAAVPAVNLANLSSMTVKTPA